MIVHLNVVKSTNNDGSSHLINFCEPWCMKIMTSDFPNNPDKTILFAIFGSVISLF